MRDLIGVQEIEEVKFKLKGENVGDKDKVNLETKLHNPK